MSSLANAVCDRMLSLELLSKGGVGARLSTQSIQEANGKTGAAGRRGALRGPEAWLGRERKDGEENEDEKIEDEKRTHASEDDNRKHEDEDER